MSELINTHDNRTTIRWKLLTGASALALTAYVSSAGLARAEDSDRPQVWIELGGQMEMMQGLNAPFTAPFMTAFTPTPGPYKNNIFMDTQRPPRFAFGEEGKISFQPENSDWIISAGIRYGRSHANRHVHQQTKVPPYVLPNPSNGNLYTFNKYAAPFADTRALSGEKHTILDFSAGKDIGLGMFGHNGSSTLSAGVRFAEFASHSSVDIQARPFFHPDSIVFGVLPLGFDFDQYHLSGHAARNFSGIGPSLSWDASAAIAGNVQDGELTLDWGVGGALLFGRQKTKTDHKTSGYHFSGGLFFESLVPHPPSTHNPPLRSHRVTVPDASGFVGLSYRYTDAKLSIGYRYDTFLNAMDTGIDTAKKSNLTFNGPYASISIGLGD